MATDARDLSTDSPNEPERINVRPENVDIGSYKFGWHDPVRSVFTPKKGLSHDVVEEISQMKHEPEWMRAFRHKALDHFYRRPMPSWGADLSTIDFDDIYYFLRATEKQAASWEDLPEDIKTTYDRLGIPEAEKQRLIAGVAAQYECMVGETRVWTANRGLVPIKDVAAGDHVFSLDEDTGRFVLVPVRASAQTDVRQTYEVKVGGRTIRATDNHPMLVLEDARRPGRVRSRYRRTWKTVGELRVGDLVAVPRTLPEFGVTLRLPPLVDPSHRTRAPAETSVDLLWLLGYFLGDGSLQSAGRTHRVQFAVPVADAELRAEITRIVGELFGVPAIAADDQRLVVNSRPLVEWFQQLGFVGTSLTKQVPAWVFGLPTAQRLAFLGGWVDADGYVPPKQDSSVALTSGNQPLLEQAAELAVLCGLRTSSIHEFSSRHPFDADRRITGFRLGISGDFDRLDCRNPKRTDRFGRRRYFHSNTTAKGTTFRTHTTEHLGFARVTSITPGDVEPVYDIEVDGPHNFIAEGMVVHNSEVVYHKVREDLERQGVVFLDTDTALREHEEIFRKHWATVIPANDNKFAALNSAVWSGGSFVWVPEGVHVEIPLQAYFRINSQNMGQFERTLIIAEPGSSVHYVEGCTAPVYSSDSLHSAVVEIIVKPHAKVRYTTIQNWSNNVYNLVTKRAAAYEDATMEWIDGNIGCLTAGALVYIHGRGPVAIKDVQVGDEIYAADLQAMSIARRRVNAVVDNGVREVFKLTTTNYREIRATANHPFLALTREPHARTWRLRWQALEDLREGDLIAISDGLPDEGVPRRIDFRPNLTGIKQVPKIPETTDEDLLWLLGCYLGDGYIERESGRPRRVNFAVPETDPARARVERLITEKLGLSWKPNYNGVVIRVGSIVFGEFILHMGFGGGANEKRIPPWLYDIPAAQRLAFIEGYLAADGHVRNQSIGEDGQELGQMAFASSNRELLEDLRMLMISVGLNPLKISTYEKIYTSHYLTLNLRELPAIRERKAPAAGIEFVRIRSIEPDGEEPVYDIEVDGSHNFVANGLVVHNSKVTMKYPAVLMLGEHAHGEVLSVAFAGRGQHQDAGAKLTFAAPNTTGQIVSKSISRDTGRTSYRGLIKVEEQAPGVKATVRCDALMLDDDSRSDTYPYMDIKQEDVTLGHEATVSRIGDDQLFYLRSRGLTEAEAAAMIVRGFVEPVAKELPMEYALELNRLIALQMEGAIG